MLLLPPILLVDDEPECLELGEHLIRKSGVPNPLVIRTSGDAAIEYLTECLRTGEAGAPPVPALIVLDLRMPGPDGLEVVRWVRQRGLFHRTRIILWSGSATPAQCESARRAGADAVFTKFPNAVVFAAAVRAALNSPGQSRAAIDHAFARAPNRFFSSTSDR